MTTYKLASAILVSVPNFNVVVAVNSVVTSAFSGILFDFFDYNRSSNYIITPYRSTIIDMLIG